MEKSQPPNDVEISSSYFGCSLHMKKSLGDPSAQNGSNHNLLIKLDYKYLSNNWNIVLNMRKRRNLRGSLQGRQSAKEADFIVRENESLESY